jgi:tripartite-type tricarboxylate transporter receptor subunit TctC
MHKAIGWGCVAVVCAVSAAASAQSYPAKSVKILSSGGAGGPNDTQTRGLAQYLGERMGQSFVVENRTGAGGIVAGEACAKAPPDGYTLCTFGSGAISWTPVLTHMPYDPIKDLTGIFHMGFIDSIINAHPSVPANSLGELVALARAKPGYITWASFGLTTSSYF